MNVKQKQVSRLLSKVNLAVIEILLQREVAGWPREEALRARLAQLLEDIFLQLDWQEVESELSAVFTDDRTIRQLNAQWRGQDKPTNVLSFPAFALKAGERPCALMGDIVLALETIQREAVEQNKTFDDHLTHLMVHGILHLLGFDHQTTGQAQIMEGLERKILARHAIADPYSERM